MMEKMYAEDCDPPKPVEERRVFEDCYEWLGED